MSSKLNAVTLRITQPDGSVHDAVAQQESVILGSGPGAMIRLQDPSVSNLHVMLKLDASQVTAIDLGSESGTRVGASALKTPVTLASGDVLTLGHSRVTVLFGAPRKDEARPLPLQGFLTAPEASKPTVPAARPNAPMSAPSRAPSAKPAVPHHPPMEPSRAPVPTADTVPAVNPGTGFGMGTAAVAMMPHTAVHRAHRPVTKAEVNAWRLISGPVPAGAAPTSANKVLQISMLWGDRLLGVEHFADNVPVTIGDAKDVRFQVFSPSVGTGIELARAEGDAIKLRLPQDAHAVVYRAHSEVGLETLRQEGRVGTQEGLQTLTLTLQERARVELGAIGFMVRFVKPTPHVKVHGHDREDGLFGFIALGCALVVGLGLAWVMSQPRPQVSIAESLRRDQQYVNLLMNKPTHTPPLAASTEQTKKSGMEEGEKAKDDEGKFGREEAKKLEADPSKKGAPIVEKDKREKDRKKVMTAGLLGAVGSHQGSASDVFGPGGLGTGINDALGGLKGGAGLGDQHGVGGLGSRGTGTGGGGAGLGLGGLGTKGKGAGAGGYGSIDLGGKSKDTTRIVPGKTTVVGGLSKDVIAKIIRQHQSEIKYCYESELQKSPELSGKVAVAFVIDGTGAVSEANVSETTLGNNPAEQCMITKIRRWKFPEPVGGGVVSVSFPWVFKPAGGGGEG